jgi:hypothetical protein
MVRSISAPALRYLVHEQLWEPTLIVDGLCSSHIMDQLVEI